MKTAFADAFLKSCRVSKVIGVEVTMDLVAVETKMAGDMEEFKMSCIKLYYALKKAVLPFKITCLIFSLNVCK